MQGSPDVPAGRRLARLFVFPLLMALIMIGTYIPAMRAPQPNGVEIAVAGATVAEQQVIDAYAEREGDRYTFVPVRDAEIARGQVQEQEVAAALVLHPDAGDFEAGSGYASIPSVADEQLPTAGVAYIATAGGSTRASGALLPVQNLALELGMPLEVRDMVTLNPGDGAGIGAMFFGMAVTLAGFLSITTLSSAAPELMKLRSLAIALPIFGLVVSLLTWFLTHVVVGAVDGAFLPLIVTGVLTVMAAGFGAAFFNRLVGPMAILLSMFVFIALGMTASGVSVPMEFAPELYRVAHEFLTFPATTQAVKSVMYFDNDGLGSYWLVLVGWIVVMGIAFDLMNRRCDRRARSGEEAASTDASLPAAV